MSKTVIYYFVATALKYAEFAIFTHKAQICERLNQIH